MFVWHTDQLVARVASAVHLLIYIYVIYFVSTLALLKPEPVTNLTLDSLLYDAASVGNKIKLTASWDLPKGRKN